MLRFVSRRGLTTKISEISVGMVFEKKRKFETADVRDFAEVSHDKNPLHLDPEIAAKSRFGKPIVHGMLTASMFSAMLGNAIDNSIYVSQSISFKAPVFIGDSITARIEVVKTRPDKRIATFKTQVIKDDGTLVVDGEAVLVAPETCVVK